MKKIIPSAVIFFLWAASAIGGGLTLMPETQVFSTFYSFESVAQSERVIEIFPNPVTEGRLTIKTSEIFWYIQILNITGEIVFSQEYPSGSVSEVIELNKLGKGVYLVRLGFSGKITHTEKIMIK
jgi:hypothetical protein